MTHRKKPPAFVSIEQQARDLLERIGVKNAQSYSAGDLVELANLIAERDALRQTCRRFLDAPEQSEAEVAALAQMRHVAYR